MDAVFHRGREHIQRFGQFGGILVGDVKGNLYITPFDQCAARGGAGYFADDDALGCGQGAANPVIVAFINKLFTRAPARDLVRARSGGRRVQIFKRPRVIIGGMFQRLSRVDDVGHRNGKIGNGQFGRAIKLDDKCRVILGNELFGTLKAAGLHLNGRETTNGHRSVKGPFHIRRRHLAPIPEGGVRLDLKR